LHWLIATLRQHPELAVFATLAIGFAIGKLRVAGFQIRSVVGVLLTGVAVGQLEIEVASALQYAFFLLFLFAIGFKTGPQFFRGLRGSGLSQAGLTLLLCGTGLATAIGVSRLFGFDAGTAGGLIAGALTESAAVGTASAAVERLHVDEAAKQLLTAKVTVAFAVSYLVGLVSTIQFLSRLAPLILRVDVAAECRRLEEEMGFAHEEAGVVSVYFHFIARAYEIPAALAGRRVADLEALFAGERVFVERVRRGRRCRSARLISPCARGIASCCPAAASCWSATPTRCARSRPRTRSCSTSRPCRSTWCSPARPTRVARSKSSAARARRAAYACAG